MSRYVPPAMRGQNNSASACTSNASIRTGEQKPSPAPSPPQDSGLVSMEEIANHFFPSTSESTKSARPPELRGTLNASAQTPSRLAYITLFHGANPRWESDGIIFTKTRLELLPASERQKIKADDPVAVSKHRDDVKAVVLAQTGPLHEPKSGPEDSEPARPGQTDVPITDSDAYPIAVFAQTQRAQHGRTFHHTGWYKLARVAYLEPGSAELARMPEQKWQRTDRFGRMRPLQRDPEKWKESLGPRWAVVKLVRDEGAEGERGELRVERLPDTGGEVEGGGSGNGDGIEQGKSVYDMLAEMRMKD